MTYNFLENLLSIRLSVCPWSHTADIIFKKQFEWRSVENFFFLILIFRVISNIANNLKYSIFVFGFRLLLFAVFILITVAWWFSFDSIDRLLAKNNETFTLEDWKYHGRKHLSYQAGKFCENRTYSAAEQKMKIDCVENISARALPTIFADW